MVARLSRQGEVDVDPFTRSETRGFPPSYPPFARPHPSLHPNHVNVRLHHVILFTVLISKVFSGRCIVIVGAKLFSMSLDRCAGQLFIPPVYIQIDDQELIPDKHTDTFHVICSFVMS